MFRKQCEGHRDRGAAAVEIALVLPLLIAMLFGIIDVSRLFNAELQLSQAAREGARLASLRPNPTSTDLGDIRTRAQQAAPSIGSGANQQACSSAAWGPVGEYTSSVQSLYPFACSTT